MVVIGTLSGHRPRTAFDPLQTFGNQCPAYSMTGLLTPRMSNLTDVERGKISHYLGLWCPRGSEWSDQ
jgi:hypothetical protein